MATRKTTRTTKKRDTTNLFKCKDCKHSYDWQSKALDGHLILCRCQYYSDGKWCKFLHDWQCDKFVKRTTEDDAPTE